MSKTCNLWASVALTILLVSGATVLAHAAAIDATLFTTYGMDSNRTGVSWVVCGSTQQSSGCYAAGALGPFGKIGALMEGNPSTHTNTVTRAIYVVDVASNGADVVLYVYKKTDTITAQTDTVSVTLDKTVNLPLIGGTDALCSMAANKGFLFIGTDRTPQGVEVTKKKLGVTTFGGFSPPLNVTAITADKYGYVTATFGGSGSPGAFIVFGPNGGFQEDGGGTPFTLNPINAVLPSTLPQ
ncbi:MAG: hypothetical protein WAQ52_15475 [Terriglobales bacterium]